MGVPPLTSSIARRKSRHRGSLSGPAKDGCLRTAALGCSLAMRSRMYGFVVFTLADCKNSLLLNLDLRSLYGQFSPALRRLAGSTPVRARTAHFS